MENKDFNPDIINYLYGEMSDKERKAFEDKMKNDPALKAEIEELQGVRDAMGTLVDKEVMEPEIKIDHAAQDKKYGSERWIKPFLAVAASIAVLLITGFYTNFNIKYNDDGLLIGFSEDAPGKYIEEPQVEEMIQKALAAQQATFDQQLSTTRDSLKEYLASTSKRNEGSGHFSESVSSKWVSESELTQQMDKMRSGQMALFQKYIEVVNKQQQDYLQEALVQFSDYLQQQREEDLLTIQRNLNDLKDYEDQHKQVTNQLLANIIATVNNEDK